MDNNSLIEDNSFWDSPPFQDSGFWRVAKYHLCLALKNSTSYNTDCHQQGKSKNMLTEIQGKIEKSVGEVEKNLENYVSKIWQTSYLNSVALFHL